MTPTEFSRIQDFLGLNDDQLAERLGLEGKRRARTVQRWKSEGPPDWVAEKLQELANERR